MSRKDDIYSKPYLQPSGFVFDAAVAEAFDDMVTRSVPFYEEFQSLTATFVANIVQPGDTVIDYGCSTGTTLAQIDARLGGRGATLLGVDTSQDMLDRAASKLTATKSQVRLIQGSMTDVSPEHKARAIVCLFVLQFLRPLEREPIIKKIFNELLPGGRLLLGEKIVESDPHFSRELITEYHRYKADRGYSAIEIARKREALENVLIPFTLDENINLLHMAGFSFVDFPFRWNNFVLFLGQK